MSLTISASAGEDSVCSVTKARSLLSVAPRFHVQALNQLRASSAQRVIPGSYSASQMGTEHG